MKYMSRGRKPVNRTVTPEIRKLVTAAKRADRDVSRAEDARREAAQRRMAAIAALSATGMTNRQIGELVGTTGEAIRVALHRWRYQQEK